MNKFFSIAAAAAVFTIAPAAADQIDGVYVGGQIGYHDVGSLPGGGDIDGVTYGGYGGFNRPIGGNLFVGGEGNFNLGGGDIDSEYGLNAHIGAAVGPATSIFLRGGYQWVDFDLVGATEDFLGRPLTPVEADLLDGADDTDGGVLVGGGVQFGLAPNISVRGVVDTIEFDTVRVTGGLSLHF